MADYRSADNRHLTIGRLPINTKHWFCCLTIGSRAYIVNTVRSKNGLHAFGNNSAKSEPIWMICYGRTEIHNTKRTRGVESEMEGWEGGSKVTAKLCKQRKPRSTSIYSLGLSPFVSLDHPQSAHYALCVLCLAADQLITRQSLNLQRCYWPAYT